MSESRTKKSKPDIIRVWSKRHGRYMYAFDARIGPRGRKRRVRRQFETREIAEAVLSQLRLDAHADEFGLPRVRALVPLTALITANENSGKNTPHHKAVIRCLKELSALRPGIAVQSLTVADLEAYVAALRGRGLCDTTIRNYLIGIGAALHSASDYFPSLEHWQAPRIPYPIGEPPGREHVITRSDTRALLDVLRNPPKTYSGKQHTTRYDLFPVLADLVEMALLTVRRQSELLTIRKVDVNLDADLVRIVNHKGKEVFQMPISGRAKAILRERMTGRKPGDYIFIPPSETLKGFPQKLQIVLERACNLAGIPYGYAQAGGLVYHDLRHTAATNILQAGHDLATLQSLSRHSNRTMALRYGHATSRSQRAAVESLADFTVPESSANASDASELSDSHDLPDDGKTAVDE